jgi:O-antigen/teichoic acid export membrane protein
MLSILDQAIVSGTSFLTAAIVGRLTSPDFLGLYYLILSIALIVSGIQEYAIAGPYIVYSKRRTGRELAEYAGSFWLQHLVLTALATVGLLVAIVLSTAVGKTNILPGLWALLATGPLLLLRDGIRRFAFANLNAKTAIPLDAVVAAVQLGGLALIGRFGLLSLFSVFAVMGLACGLASLGWYFLSPPFVEFRRQRFVGDWRHNWALGKWALRSYLIGCTTSPIMFWILTLAVGDAATGVFGACNTLVGVTSVVLVGVCNVLTPQAAQAFATGGTKDLLRILFRTAAFLVLATSAFCLFVMLTGDWLVVLVFGAGFHGTGAVLITLALNSVIVSLGAVVGNGLWAIDRLRLNFFADACGLSVMLIAAALLIFRFGALGAAFAVLAGSVVGGVVRAILFARSLEASVIQLNPVPEFPSPT